MLHECFGEEIKRILEERTHDNTFSTIFFFLKTNAREEVEKIGPCLRVAFLPHPCHHRPKTLINSFGPLINKAIFIKSACFVIFRLY